MVEERNQLNTPEPLEEKLPSLNNLAESRIEMSTLIQSANSTRKTYHLNHFAPAT